MAFQARLNVLIMKVLGFLGCFLASSGASLWSVAMLCADDLRLAFGATRVGGRLSGRVGFLSPNSEKKVCLRSCIFGYAAALLRLL